MIQIEKIDKKDKKIIDTLVDIHMESFTGFFLTFLGRGFLRLMYNCYCDYKDSGFLVAVDKEKDNIVGFLAYSGDLSGLYKFMLKNKWFLFAWYSLGGVRLDRAYRVMRKFTAGTRYIIKIRRY